MAESLSDKQSAGLDRWIIGFLSIFIIGLFNEHLTALRNLGLYTALLLALFKVATQWQWLLAEVRVFIVNTRVPLALLLLFCASAFFSSLFSYTQGFESLASLFNETKLMLVFFLIMLTINDKERLLQWIIYAMVVAMAVGSWHFLAKDMPALSELHASFRVSRNYANYYEYLFPFALYQLFIEKRGWLKTMIAIVLLLGMLTLVLSGVRGAWLAVAVEFSIVIGYVLYYHRHAFKKLMPFLIAGTVIVASFLFFTFESSSVVKSAFDRGISLNNRDRIVKERLPIFMEHGDKVFGLGHGGAQYHRFMHDHDAPKSIGRNEGGVFVFNRDEPFMIQLFLHFGFVGLVLVIFLLGYMLIDLLRINKYTNFCGVSILSGLVGVFLVRGLFEGRYLSGLLFIVVLYLIQRSIVNSLSSTKSEMVS